MEERSSEESCVWAVFENFVEISRGGAATMPWDAISAIWSSEGICLVITIAQEGKLPDDA
jgi:hypothetical protein